ncbi:MAG: hypothetical protein AB7T38_17535 [Nitrospirales bacterium]
MLWDFLNRDVAVIGDLASPLLSWLGAFGMVFFVAWQAMKLKKEAATVHRAFNRVDPIVTALAEGRQNLEHDRFTSSTPNEPPATNTPTTAPVRVDRDDLHTLDTCMDQEPLFRGLWGQYRRTLMLEHVPWFLEPRIFGTRRAAEVFTQDALFASHVNLGFYRHLPSLITGFGLLLTFLALLIGLGKLHAEGGEIVGIQGLINGLAGKFLTSIVGLSMAQLFLLIERPVISRLTSTHQKFLERIDRLFSRKTVESMMEELLALQRQRQNTGPATGQTCREEAGGGETYSLAKSTIDLTAAIHALTKSQEEEHARTRRTITELPRLLREAVQSSLQEFTTSIQELSQELKEVQPDTPPVEKAIEDRPLLWKTAAYPRDTSKDNLLDKIAVWPRRQEPAKHRRTG